MIYQNPIIRGFYPDPSVCKANDTYYLVCSSMQYFPAVPLFESKDLVNWTQIGHCLTRESQIDLATVPSSGGVFAPTIRYHEGRFYMCTTNSTSRRNFFVWTDDIHGEWSDPIYIEQDGIDPSLLFDDDGKVYFLSTGLDDDGIDGIIQCEIDIQTGKKLTKSKMIWLGSGGRYVEGPHMYKIGEYYYLVAAEGGTEYGHMATYARSASPYGPFTLYKNNPFLTNRNLGGNEIQGVGHGDLIEYAPNRWCFIHLGFRQMGKWLPFHQLGREVFISPITWDKDGWFHSAEDGTTKSTFTLEGIYHNNEILQDRKNYYTFENTDWNKDWCYLRIPKTENYQLETQRLILSGTKTTLDDLGSPTWIGLRQKDFCGIVSCHVTVTGGEAGITVYMDEDHHYDLAIQKTESGYEAVKRLNIGDIKSTEQCVTLSESNEITLNITFEHEWYHFSITENGQTFDFGSACSRYVTTEVAGGFTGVMFGLYAVDPEEKGKAVFKEFKCEYR